MLIWRYNKANAEYVSFPQVFLSILQLKYITKDTKAPLPIYHWLFMSFGKKNIYISKPGDFFKISNISTNM